MATNAPHTRVATASTADEITRRAVAGETSARIARDLGVPIATVRHTLYTNARRIRDQTADRVARRFLRHDEILARLIETWCRDLNRGYDRDIAGSLLKAMERQAKLLGLDIARSQTLGTDSWIAECSDAELVEQLRTQYGIVVPPEQVSPARH
jgi:DNA-binding CsgD family transcriptional regulator